jgi:hypothetical protein
MIGLAHQAIDLVLLGDGVFEIERGHAGIV